MTDTQTMRVSRQLRESLGWRLIAELVNRSPKGLHVIETHPSGGDHDCLSLHDGSSGHVLDLDRNEGIVIAGIGSSPDIWELLVSEGPVAIADDIEESWLVDPDGRPVIGRSANVSLLADIAAVASPRGWVWRSGMFDPGEGPPGPIAFWFIALDDLPEGVLGTMAVAPIDRAEFRFWFLVRDLHQDPLIAIDVAGTGWINGAPWALADDRDRQAFLAAALMRSSRA
jgi:type III secretion system-like peptide-binding chaperone